MSKSPKARPRAASAVPEAPQPYLAGTIVFREPGTGDPIGGVTVTRDANEVVIQDHRGAKSIELRLNTGYAEQLETLIRGARRHKERT